MTPNSPLYPPAASGIARDVDHLFLFALGGAIVFSTLIAVLVVVFATKFRRRHEGEVGSEPNWPRTLIEITWTAIPFGLLMVLFVWGTHLYFRMSRPPADAIPYTVVGRQWMWKIQHPDGHREINEIHVPRGKPVKFTMTSEDVIHDLFVPAMRVKADVIPGRYTTLWFNPDTVGEYHLFCSQYCGAEHSKMVGRVVVMEPQDYEAWLRGTKAGTTPEESGEALFTRLACGSCHRSDTAARAPVLNGLPGRRVDLASGGTLVADDVYIRESIVNPMAKVTLGYQPIMPTYRNQLTEEQILELIAYIRSLPPAPASAFPQGATLPKEKP